MKILPAGLLALISLLLPLADTFAQSDQSPPTAIIVKDDFSPMQSQWEPVSGTWSVADGTYGNNSSGATEITRITFYRDVHPAGPGNSVVTFEDFTVSARMRNSGTTDAHFVGLVYGYQDSQNYYELLVSATGKVRMRTVMNGVAVDKLSFLDEHIPRNQWFDVEVHWDHGKTSAKVNGLGTATVSQPEFTTGQVGLVTHGAVGRFDKVFLGVPFGDQAFLEMFDEPPFVTFTPQSGQWSVVNGTYRNSAVQQTNVTLAPIHTGFFPNQGDTMDYTFRARMLNPYGGSGNLIGIVFNYQTVQYTEVVFSPTGVVKLNRFENGAAHTIATASYPGARNVGFNVTVENGSDHFAVVVNGTRLFTNVDIFDVNPNQVPDGGVGLITHWTPGRFDNVEFKQGFFTPCSITFSEQPQVPWQVVSGTWNANGGTLNNTSIDASSIVQLPCGSQGIIKARLRNEFGASGNLVGLIYNYQAFDWLAGDHYEVTFSPTGVVQLNKFIQGVRYPVQTGTYSVPRNTWFDVQLIHDSGSTMVTVNGATVIAIAFQAELQGGFLGVVSHWSKGHFDTVTLIEPETGAPSEL
jgi:hypothetical protein